MPPDVPEDAPTPPDTGPDGDALAPGDAPGALRPDVPNAPDTPPSDAPVPGPETPVGCVDGGAEGIVPAEYTGSDARVAAARCCVPRAGGSPSGCSASNAPAGAAEVYVVDDTPPCDVGTVSITVNGSSPVCTQDRVAQV
jgi:hypothetical protein